LPPWSAALFRFSPGHGWSPSFSPLRRRCSPSRCSIPLGQRCRLPPPVGRLRWHVAPLRTARCPQESVESGEPPRCPRKDSVHNIIGKRVQLGRVAFDESCGVIRVDEHFGTRHSNPSGPVRKPGRVKGSLAHRQIVENRGQDDYARLEGIYKVRCSNARVTVARWLYACGCTPRDIRTVQNHRVDQVVEGAQWRPCARVVALFPLVVRERRPLLDCPPRSLKKATG
jgi:hypothetical protein